MSDSRFKVYFTFFGISVLSVSFRQSNLSLCLSLSAWLCLCHSLSFPIPRIFSYLAKIKERETGSRGFAHHLAPCLPHVLFCASCVSVCVCKGQRTGSLPPPFPPSTFLPLPETVGCPGRFSLPSTVVTWRKFQ